MARGYCKNNSKKRLKPTIFLSKNRRGLSGVVTTVILIAVSVVAVGAVWVLVNNMIKNQTERSQACYDNYEKVELNGQYTCYERIAAGNYKLRFSIGIGDAEISKVIVSVSSAGITKSYEITEEGVVISGLVMYSGSNPTNVTLPGKNSGLTYNATGFTDKIDSIEIAPYVGKNLCEVSDSITQIEDCNLFF